MDMIPEPTKQKVMQMATQSQREPEDVVIMALEHGLDALRDQPWFPVPKCCCQTHARD